MEQRPAAKRRGIRARGGGRRLGGPGTWLLVIALAAAAILADRLLPADIEGVAHVVDGDSLAFGEERVRLIGIDAPELAQTCPESGGVVACGRRARDHLRALLAGRVAQCRITGIDRYGRSLARCRAGETDVNAAMVRDGWAIDGGDYPLEEAEARRQRRGLWAMQFDRPAAWRAQHPRQTEAAGEAGLTQRLRGMLLALRAWLIG